jgi:hypothetical protein
MPQMKNNLRKNGQLLRKEMRERTMGYIMTGFGVVAGLAWNEAIKALIEHIFPPNSNSIIAKFIYAILMTFVVVFLAVYLVRIFKKEEVETEDEKEKKQ